MRVFVDPRSNDPLGRRIDPLDEAGNGVLVAVAPAADRQRRSLDRRKILADRASPAVSLFNVPRVREMLDAPLESSGFGPNRRRVELVISLDDWLRRYPVRLRLDS